MLDDQKQTIILDGERHVIKNRGHYRFFRAIALQNGKVVSKHEFKDAKYERPDRVKRHLPPVIAKLIVGEPGHGGGFRLSESLTPPPKLIGENDP